jgi:hypothetical protein
VSWRPRGSTRACTGAPTSRSASISSRASWRRLEPRQGGRVVPRRGPARRGRQPDDPMTPDVISCSMRFRDRRRSGVRRSRLTGDLRESDVADLIDDRIDCRSAPQVELSTPRAYHSVDVVVPSLWLRAPLLPSRDMIVLHAYMRVPCRLDRSASTSRPASSYPSRRGDPPSRLQAGEASAV